MKKTNLITKVGGVTAMLIASVMPATASAHNPEYGPGPRRGVEVSVNVNAPPGTVMRRKVGPLGVLGKTVVRVPGVNYGPATCTPHQAAPYYAEQPSGQYAPVQQEQSFRYEVRTPIDVRVNIGTGPSQVYAVPAPRCCN